MSGFGRKQLREIRRAAIPRQERCSLGLFDELFQQLMDLIELRLELGESRQLHVELLAHLVELIFNDGEDIGSARRRSRRAAFAALTLEAAFTALAAFASHTTTAARSLRSPWARVCGHTADSTRNRRTMPRAAATASAWPASERSAREATRKVGLFSPLPATHRATRRIVRCRKGVGTRVLSESLPDIRRQIIVRSVPAFV